MDCMIHDNKKTEKETHRIAYFAWEQVKNNIYPAFTPLGYRKEGPGRDSLACSSFLDLDICYYVRSEGLGSPVAGIGWISNTALEAWGVAMDVLEAQAMENLMGDGYRIYNIEEVLEPVVGKGSMPDPARLYVLTNRSGIHGAAGILDKGLISNFSKGMGTGLYILPSSRHEVLLLPGSEGTDAGGLSRIVAEINGMSVSPEDRLADHAYYYDRHTDEIRIAG